MRIVNWFASWGSVQDRLIVALSGAAVGRRVPPVSQRELRQPREARLGDRVVGEGLPRGGVDDRGRKPARQLIRRRDGVERAETALDARAFIVDQEERLVSPVVERQPDRTALDEPKLFLIELRLLGVRRIEEVPRVQLFVSEKPEAGAVERVGAGLADDVDLVGAEAVLRRVGRRLLLEFLDGVDREDCGRGAERRVGVGGAVEHVVVRGRPRAHDADGVAHALPHPRLLAGGFHRPGTEEQQLQKVPAVQRQLGDLLLGNCVADGRACRVERQRRRCHFDSFGNVAGFQPQVDALNLIDAERHTGADGHLEARLLCGHDVHADWQQRNDEVANICTCCLAGQTRLLVGDDDLDLRHHGPGRIFDRAGNLARRGLRARWSGRAEQRGKHRGE